MILGREEALAHARDCEEQTRRDKKHALELAGDVADYDGYISYLESRAHWNENLARQARELAENFPPEGTR